MTTECSYAKPCTVLLVEDNLEHAELAIYALRKAREAAFEVEHVDQLSAALARLARGGIDVALIDLSLPDSNGMETFQAIRAAAPGVPIVVFTGMEDEKFVLEMLHQGAQDYLLKHEVEPRLLARSLRFAIERQRNAALEECIQKLPAAERILIQQRYQGAADIEELIQTCGMSRRTLFRTLQRIRRLLHDCINQRVAAESP